MAGFFRSAGQDRGRGAVLALDQLGHRDEPGPVLDTLRSGGSNLLVAVSAAAWFPSPATVDALVPRLQDEDELVVQATAESSADIGDDRGDLAHGPPGRRPGSA